MFFIKLDLWVWWLSVPTDTFLENISDVFHCWRLGSNEIMPGRTKAPLTYKLSNGLIFFPPIPRPCYKCLLFRSKTVNKLNSVLSCHQIFSPAKSAKFLYKEVIKKVNWSLQTYPLRTPNTRLSMKNDPITISGIKNTLETIMIIIFNSR